MGQQWIRESDGQKYEVTPLLAWDEDGDLIQMHINQNEKMSSEARIEWLKVPRPDKKTAKVTTETGEVEVASTKPS
jgi:hypothetical protein